MYRCNNRDCVEDHICKTVNSVAQKWMNRIPGSDWRDLPNIFASAEDGRMARSSTTATIRVTGPRVFAAASWRRDNYCDQDRDKEVYGRAPWDGYFKLQDHDH